MIVFNRNVFFYIGTCLAIFGFLFIFYRLNSYWNEINFSRFHTDEWFKIGLIAFVHGMSNFLLALAWWFVLMRLGAVISCQQSIGIYGISQLARYLPGNIAHYAGRQMFGMSAGVPGWIMVKSAFYELCIICIAGFIFSVPLIQILYPGFSIYFIVFLFIGVACIVSYAFLIMYGQYILLTFVLHLLYLFLSGCVFLIVLSLVTSNGFVGFDRSVAIVAVFIVAWLIGVITPGAPAGVGVREIVLLMMLKNYFAEIDLIFAILVSRLITVSGDLSFFCLCYFQNYYFSKKQNYKASL